MPDNNSTLPPLRILSVGESPISRTATPLGGSAAQRLGVEAFIAPPTTNPKKIAQGNRLSRETGLPLDVVDGDEDGIEQMVKAMGALSLAAQDMVYSEWAAQNPREAAISAEDTKALTGLASFWDDVKKIMPRAGGGVYDFGGMVADTVNIFNDAKEVVESPIHALNSAIGRAFGIDGLDPKNYLREQRKRRLMVTTALNDEANRIAEENKGNNRITEGLLSGVRSLPMTAAAILTRNAKIGAGMFGTLTGADSFTEAREQGLGMGESIAYAAGTGALEGGTEMFALNRWLDVTTKKVPFVGGVLSTLAAEMTGEQINTFLSDMLRMVHLPENANMTVEDFIAARPDAAIDTALAVLGTTGSMAAGIKTAEAVSNMAARIVETREAKARGKALDDGAKFARESGLRADDPEAFRELMRRKAEASNAQDIFIPAEAIRAYQQSDSYDPDSDPFDPRRWEVDDLAANGQDVVIPFEDFLTDIAASPAFDALKDDIRFVGGAMSVREAMEADEAFADVSAQLEAEYEAEQSAGRAEKSIRDRLIDRVAGQFGVSYTAPVARQIAELAVAREETRAARMGRNLSLQTLADLDVRQVMPESAREIKAADQLDLVLNAMQQGKPARYGRGDSLMRWAKKRGGILDQGGDLASMGVHHSFIESGDLRQGNVFGASGLSELGLDNTLRAAIEAGYFPELEGMRDGQGLDDLDVNVLLEAISDELAGNPRFTDWVDDNIRAAADDLGDALRSAGFDPANMTEEQIREAVETMMVDSAMDVGGAAYEQEALPDAIDVDGVMRGTVNSNGQPLGRTVEEVENFWRWFGSSRVVDDQGRPLVVYHGTSADIEAFDLSNAGATDAGLVGQGIYATPDRVLAESYGDNLIEGYASVQNPYLIIDGLLPDGVPLIDAHGGALTDDSAARLNAAIKNDGHDGAIFSMFDEISQVVAFSPEQIKSVNNRGTFDASDARILNQADIEQPLYVVHNLSADKLRHADELGGLAAPSLAIARGDIGFDGFGEISLIGDPSMADPKGKGVRAFAADIYSPRQPRARYKVGKKAFEKMRKALAPVAEKFGLRFYASESDIERGGLSDLIGSDVAKAAWLESLGESVEVKFEEVRPPEPLAGYEAFKGTDGPALRNDPDFIAKVNRKKELAFKRLDNAASPTITEERVASAWGPRGEPVHGHMLFDIAMRVANQNKAIAEFKPSKSDRIDTYETGKAIDAAVKGREAEFNAWVSEQFGDMLGAAFFENEDGRKREYTLANVVKEMTRALRNGENWNYGAGNVRAAVAPEFKKLADVQAARGNIIPEADALKDEVNGELLALADKFSPYAHNGDDFGFVDTFADFLKDMAKGPRAVEQWQNEWFKSPAPQELLNEAAEFLEKLKALPTEYFEIKMQRAVDFSEFSAAVVPANLPADARAILEGAGLDLVEYDGTPEGRQAAVQSIGSRVFFQERAESKPRGRIVFDQNKRVIELFEGRNISTAIHELSHMWLEDLQADAADAAILLAGENLDPARRASLETVVADWEKVKKYFADNGHAVGADGVVPVDAHELWARSGERYVMEGKAPAGALTELFRSFAAFMVRIYKSVDALRAPITPEIREVFDRLIATDQEIAAARDVQGLSALFDDAAAAGMSEQEFAAYERLIAASRDNAESKLLAKVMRAITVRETKLYKERAEAIREEVEEALDATPLFRALGLMAGRRAPKMPKVAAGAVRLWEAPDGSGWQRERGDAEFFLDVKADHPAMKGAGDSAIALPEELTGDAQLVPTGDEAMRISRQWIVDRLGADALKLLPVRVPPLYADGGVDPQSVAEMSGYATADEMLNAIIGAEKVQREVRAGGDKRPMRKRMVDDSVKDEMMRRHGDPLTDGSIEREALEAVRNDEAGELMATELRVLGRGGGAANRVTPWRVAKSWARNKVRSGEVRAEASASAVQRYQRAAAKASREAEVALAANDREGAFAAKHRQMMNAALASEASAALREVEAAVTRMNKIAKARTRASIDQDYLERAQALLEEIDLKRRSQISINRAEKFEEWADRQRDNGIDIITPKGFLEDVAKTNWSRLSVDDLLIVDETIKQILHLGSLKQTLKDAKEARDFEEAVSEAEIVASDIGRKPLPSHLDKEGLGAKLKSNILSMDAALLKMEQVFLWLDNGNSNGVFNRYVFKPLAEAQERSRRMRDEYQQKIVAHMEALPKEVKKRWGDKVTTPFIYRYGEKAGEVVTLERSQMIAMALNWGNAGNRQRLIDGEGWNETAVEAFLLSNLDQAEWQFVQSVWDTIGELWPHIQQLEKNVNGFAPEAVESVSFETPFGTMKGGYYPAVYDPRGSLTAEDQKAYRDGLLGINYTRATTRASATKERAEAVKGRPLLLDLAVISRHLGEVIHDITHREALIQAHKFLSNPRIRQLTREVLNPEIEKSFKPWLNYIANSMAYDRAGIGGFAKFLQAMRANVTVVAMGWRWSTFLTQISGFANAKEFARADDLAAAMARFSKDMSGTWKFVSENSQEMAGRAANIDVNIAAALSALNDPINDKRKKAFTIAKRFAFHGIGYMDRVVTVPTWMAVYDRSVKDGMSHDEAVYKADQAVRLSQGASGAKDMAAVQTGQGNAGEFVKSLTFFYTFFSAFYNRQRNLGRDFRRIESAKEMPNLLARTWWLIILPPMLAEWLAGRGPDDDEDEGVFEWAMKAISSQFVGGIPIVRDAYPIVWDKLAGNKSFDYRMSPITGGVESSMRMVDDMKRLAQGKETKRATRNAIETFGYATGLTTGQMAATTQFLVDLSYGDARPEDVGDWYMGLTKGKIE